MRLIDADHLRKWIIANWHIGWHHKTVDDILDQIDREITYFEDAGIVDAKPITHGHWGSRQLVYECSECGHMGYSDMNYCPNCGSLMDEEVDE